MIIRKKYNIRTSYFAKAAKHPDAVSIAGKAPDWYEGKQYKKLAPKIWFFKKYKEDGDEKFYIEQFQKEVLDKLDVKEVIEEIGRKPVLLCWESSEKFCHRHLVAKWFEKQLKTKVKEITL